MSIERYQQDVHAAEAVRLGKMMQAEGGLGSYEWDDEKFLAYIGNPNVYCSLVKNGSGYIGGMIGFVAQQYFTKDMAAKDLAIYIEPEKRGSMAAVRLVRDFEDWARSKGAKEAYLAQSTGIEIEKTRRWYEALGYSVCGFVTKRVL